MLAASPTSADSRPPRSSRLIKQPARRVKVLKAAERVEAEDDEGELYEDDEEEVGGDEGRGEDGQRRVRQAPRRVPGHGGKERRGGPGDADHHGEELDHAPEAVGAVARVFAQRKVAQRRCEPRPSEARAMEPKLTGHLGSEPEQARRQSAADAGPAPPLEFDAPEPPAVHLQFYGRAKRPRRQRARRHKRAAKGPIRIRKALGRLERASHFGRAPAAAVAHSAGRRRDCGCDGDALEEVGPEQFSEAAPASPGPPAVVKVALPYRRTSQR
mmetsp:Transcript_8120/g.26628  ORF Transcript_8120/g.26628 Transcript_8120/m.26628 type:complete len:271 (+) Transcript_8120:845-1657(+)